MYANPEPNVKPSKDEAELAELDAEFDEAMAELDAEFLEAERLMDLEAGSELDDYLDDSPR